MYGMSSSLLTHGGASAVGTCRFGCVTSCCESVKRGAAQRQGFSNNVRQVERELPEIATGEEEPVHRRELGTIGCFAPASAVAFRAAGLRQYREQGQQGEDDDQGDQREQVGVDAGDGGAECVAGQD